MNPIPQEPLDFSNKPTGAWEAVRRTIEKPTPFSEPVRFEAETPEHPGFQDTWTFLSNEAPYFHLAIGHVEKTKLALEIASRTLNTGISQVTLKFIADCFHWQTQPSLDTIVHRLKDELSNGEYDKVTLRYYRPQSEGDYAALIRELNKQKLPWLRHPDSVLHKCFVDKESAPRPSSQLQSSTLKRLQRKQRALGRSLGTIEFRKYTAPQQEDEFFENIEAFASHTWQRQHGLGGVQDNDRFRRVYKHESLQGNLQSYIMYAGDTPLAYHFGVNYGDVHHYEFIAHDERYPKYSLGQLLRLHAFEDIREDGIRWIDFGPGDYEFKKEWGTHQSTLVNLSIYSRTPKSQLVHFVDRSSKQATRIGKALYHSKWLQMLLDKK